MEDRHGYHLMPWSSMTLWQPKSGMQKRGAKWLFRSRKANLPKATVWRLVVGN